MEEQQYLNRHEDRLKVTRTAGGPDGIIGTNVEPCVTRICWHILVTQGSYIHLLSDSRTDSLPSCTSC